METLFPQAFIESAGMMSILIIIVAVQVLSLVFLLLATVEYRKMNRRYGALFAEISGGHAYARIQQYTHVIYWCYVIAIFIITFVTTAIFLFQPHLL